MGLQNTVDSLANMLTNRKHKYAAVPSPGNGRKARNDSTPQGLRFMKFAMLAVAVTILLMFTMSWE